MGEQAIIGIRIFFKYRRTLASGQRKHELTYILTYACGLHDV